jgi:proteasome lid subunit RPN8/RPN11
MTIRLPRALADQLIAHARAAAPNEACGLIGLQGDQVARYEPAANAAPNPRWHFYIDPEEVLVLLKRIEREFECDSGVFHSHPNSPAYPSATDKVMMRNAWPGCVQLMVSLRNDATAGPEVYAYRIDEAGEVTSEPLVIADERDP